MPQKTLEVLEAPQRKTRLQSIITRINKSLGNEYLAWIQTGIDLEIIERDKIFTEHNHDSFKEFVESEYAGIFDYKQARRRIYIAQRHQATLANKPPDDPDLPEPKSIAQLIPLLSYSPDEAAKIYWDAARLQVKDQGRVTGQFIEKYRRGATDIQAETVPIESTNGDSEHGEEPSDIDFSEAPTSPTLTIAATETLDKIEALSKEGVLPVNSRSAIENGVIRVAQEDLERWNECDEDRFKKIGRLIFNAALSYESAIRVLSKPMDETTTLLNFVYLSIASGGRGSVTFRGYTVSAVPA